MFAPWKADAPAWLILGISGVTCGGKTTLAKSLYNYFTNMEEDFASNLRINKVSIINQDDYFYAEDSICHTRVERLKHINWEIMSALNMIKMCSDLKNILGDYRVYSESDKEMRAFQPVYVNILIIEGFIIFNHPFLFDLCQYKYHLHLPYEKCFQRRSARVYDPPDIVGYFEACVWPNYLKHFNELKANEDANLVIINGELSKEKCFQYLLSCLREELSNQIEDDFL